MTSDRNLQFIKEKITAVKSAIMYSMSNDLIKIPNSIVTAVDVDDEGHLWFVCTPPALGLEYCSNSFPARLHFYRKGTTFHIAVSGKAEIVNAAYEDMDRKGLLLMRMDMANIEYTEPTLNSKSPVDLWIEKAYDWVLRKVGTPHNNKPVLSRLHSVNQSN